MTKQESEYEADEDEYLAKVPTRYLELTRQPKQEQVLRPWISGWD